MAYHWMEFDIIVRLFACIRVRAHTNACRPSRYVSKCLQTKIKNYAFFLKKKIVYENAIKRKSFLNEKKKPQQQQL